jgi:hypothetical protein
VAGDDGGMWKGQERSIPFLPCLIRYSLTGAMRMLNEMQIGRCGIDECGWKHEFRCPSIIDGCGIDYEG